jgi:secreted trypsin-like serine protease
MRRLALALVLCVSHSAPAPALVGGAAEVPDAAAQPEIMLLGSRGNFCTGTLIAPGLALTAAHCVIAGYEYKLYELTADRKVTLKDIAAIARHPQFSLKSYDAHRATADVALLKLAAPPPARPARLMPPRSRVIVGERFLVRGYGAAVMDEPRSAGTLRSATLIATGQPGNLQLRLVDAASGGTRPGLGACTGDSGGPVYAENAGVLALYGVVSWSTGPNAGDGCGGLTGVTPLELYRGWIEQQARRMGSAIGP